MANDEESQGGTYNVNEDDILALMNEAAKRGADEALKDAAYTRQRMQDYRDMDDDIVNPKIVKQLKDTVTIFNTLKEMSSNPMQKTIEQTVGELVAGVIQQAFSRPSGPPPKRDIVETLLNSQFAFGLGSSLGQRAPELVETMGKTFGAEKTEEIVDTMIDKYAGGRSGREAEMQSRSLNPPESESGSSAQSEDTSNLELLLSLDPNNPEHVAAYAESQGGISIDVARKMLMIHQDDIIKQMKSQGIDTQNIESIRGSHTQRERTSPEPIQQEQTITQQEQVPQDAIYQEQDYIQGNNVQQTSENMPNDQYTEYESMIPQDDVNEDISQTAQDADSQQPEILRKFAEDIGKVMGNMIDRIESLNGVVQTLQNELNEIKKGGTQYQPEEVISPTYEPDQAVTEPIQSSEEFFGGFDVKTPEEFEAELKADTEETIQKAKEEHIETVPVEHEEKFEEVSKELVEEFPKEKLEDSEPKEDIKIEEVPEEILSEESYVELSEDYVEPASAEVSAVPEKNKKDELREDELKRDDVEEGELKEDEQKEDEKIKEAPETIPVERQDIDIDKNDINQNAQYDAGMTGKGTTSDVLHDNEKAEMSDIDHSDIDHHRLVTPIKKKDIRKRLIPKMKDEECED